MSSRARHQSSAHQNVGSLARRENDNLPFDRIFHVTAVNINQLKRLQVVELKLEIPALRAVHDTPSLQGAVTHSQSRPFSPVDEYMIAFSS
jgi:hypothetical protein